MQTLETRLDGRGVRVGVIVARFNHLITLRLLEGCLARLAELGCDGVDVLWVPGAFEIPWTAQRAARSGRYDAVVALGAVIRGGTPHFEYVASEVSKGVGQVSMESECAVGFGVLTCDTMEQALERAGVKGGNKGAEAAVAAIEQANLFRAFAAGKK